MSGLVFWQKPGENYVRIGELKGTRRELRPVGAGFTYYEGLSDVKRHGTIETVESTRLQEVGSRGK